MPSCVWCLVCFYLFWLCSIEMGLCMWGMFWWGFCMCVVRFVSAGVCFFWLGSIEFLGGVELNWWLYICDDLALAYYLWGWSQAIDLFLIFYGVLLTITRFISSKLVACVYAFFILEDVNGVRVIKESRFVGEKQSF